MNQKKDYVLRWIPKYSIIPLITALVLNTLVYSGTMVLCKGLYHHDFTTAFDRMVPVIPEFTSIYLICYVFWVVNYIMTARISREHMYRFLDSRLSVKDHMWDFLCLFANNAGEDQRSQEQDFGIRHYDLCIRSINRQTYFHRFTVW